MSKPQVVVPLTNLFFEHSATPVSVNPGQEYSLFPKGAINGKGEVFYIAWASTSSKFAPVVEVDGKRIELHTMAIFIATGVTAYNGLAWACQYQATPIPLYNIQSVIVLPFEQYIKISAKNTDVVANTLLGFGVVGRYRIGQYMEGI